MVRCWKDTHDEIPQRVLNLCSSIRFCGVINKLGYLTFHTYRSDVKPILSLEDTERYALFTTIRRRTNLPWQHKVGKTRYFATRDDNLIRVTIPIDEECLLLAYFDVDVENFDRVITELILPLINTLVQRAV